MNDKQPILPNKHKGMELGDGYFCRGMGYEFEYRTEIGDENVIITAAIRINAKTKSGKKILDAMAEKQTSPIKTTIQKIEREHRIDVREGKGIPLYSSLGQLFE